MIVTRYVARHDGLEIVRGEDLGEVLAFVQARLRRLVTAPPAGSRLLMWGSPRGIHLAGPAAAGYSPT